MSQIQKMYLSEEISRTQKYSKLKTGLNACPTTPLSYFYRQLKRSKTKSWLAVVSIYLVWVWSDQLAACD